MRKVSLISLAFLLVIGLAALLPFLGRLGFYGDDWPSLLAACFHGPPGLARLFGSTRPGVGFLLGQAYSLMGADPRAWQLMLLAYRLAGALALGWALSLVWPRRRYEAAAAAALFLAYPGFSQLPASLAHAGHFAALALFGLSLALSLKALRPASRAGRLALAVPALLLVPAYLLLAEHFLALEGLRGLLMGFVVLDQGRGEPRHRIRAFLAACGPYLLLAGGFLYWRLVVFAPGGAHRPAWEAALAGPPWLFLGERLESLGRDLVAAGLLAWPRAPLVLAAGESWRVPLLLGGLGAAAGLAHYYGYRRLAGAGWRERRPADQLFGAALLATGVLAAGLALAPVALGLGHYAFPGPLDRHALPALPALALLAAGVVCLLPRGWPSAAALALLLGLGLAGQGGSAALHARQMDQVRDLAWQLAWRAPALQPGTLVVLAGPGLPSALADPGVWGPVNLLYGRPGEAMPHWGLTLQGYLAALDRPGPLATGLRGLTFLPGSPRPSGDALLAYLAGPEACLRVLGPDDPLPAGAPEGLARAAALSRPARILPAAPPARPWSGVFGPEPAPGWCGHYQKAELARQAGDWARVAELLAAARQANLAPRRGEEWLPFLAALYKLERAEEAESLAAAALELTGESERPALERALARLRPPRPAPAAPAAPAAPVSPPLPAPPPPAVTPDPFLPENPAPAAGGAN